MKKNRILLIVIVLFCVVVFLTVGYSAFSDTLNITSTVAKVRIYKDIRVAGVTVSNNGANVTNLDYSVDSISSDATISQGGTITYTVTVKNLGNVPMAIYSIDESGLPGDLTITNISGYDLTNKEKICDDNNSSVCTLNATKTFTITIGYGNYVSDNTIYNIKIGFEFVPVYDVTYSNITNNSYPIYAYEGKQFEVTFTGDIPYDIELNQNFSHTYTNNKLTIPNPTSDFTINRYYGITYNLDGGTQASNQPDRYLAGSSVTILDASKTDYTFQGWYDNASFTGNAITSTSGHSGNLTLYAKWKSSQPQTIPITDLRAGDHIIYVDANGVDRECVILYDSTSSYGIQAITSDIVENFEVGNGSGSATAVYNVSSGGGQTKFNKAVDSYKNYRQNLNLASRSYINSDLSPTDGARIVGTPPDNPDVVNDVFNDSTNTYMNSYNIPKGDSYYTTDKHQMLDLGILGISSAYWLGSYNTPTTVGSKSTNVGNYYVQANANSQSYIRHLSFNRMASSSTSKSYTYGLRPIFILKNTLYVEDNGNGIYNLIVQ